MDPVFQKTRRLDVYPCKLERTRVPQPARAATTPGKCNLLSTKNLTAVNKPCLVAAFVELVQCELESDDFTLPHNTDDPCGIFSTIDLTCSHALSELQFPYGVERKLIK